MDLQINSFQHLGIPVTDLKRSEIFYEGLGFKNVMTSSFEMEGDKSFVSMMQRSSMVIEIYQLPKHFLSEIRNRTDGHIDHIAFDVDNIDIAFKTLTENGYPIIEKEPVFLPFWKNGCRYFNMFGPDGEKLEFNQVL
jgi:catechol 2,3-dioxygenase-like lactoylglutathione lyase family enzyme